MEKGKFSCVQNKVKQESKISFYKHKMNHVQLECFCSKLSQYLSNVSNVANFNLGVDCDIIPQS